MVAKDDFWSINRLKDIIRNAQIPNIRIGKPIDRLTSIDEILRENQIILNELAKQQLVTNQLILLYMRTGIALAENQASPISPLAAATPDIKNISQAISGFGGNRYITFTRRFTNEEILGKSEILNERWGGILAEILFLSDDGDAANAAYTVKIIADGSTVYEGTYTVFSASSDYETDMTAFDDGTYYVLTFQNIAFNESILVEVTNSTATFDIIYMKIHKRIEGIV